MPELGRTLSGVMGAIALAVTLSACGLTARPAPTVQVPPGDAVLRDFADRVEKYMQLRQPLAESSPDLEETYNPADIVAAQEVLAAKIRAARKNARPGDIFTREIRAKFRRLMYPDLKGAEGRETKQVVKEDSPAPGVVDLEVNALYDSTTLATMPPNLLKDLPLLPPELEYRPVGKHLILRDVGANIIVDFIPNAIR